MGVVGIDREVVGEASFDRWMDQHGVGWNEADEAIRSRVYRSVGLVAIVESVVAIVHVLVDPSTWVVSSFPVLDHPSIPAFPASASLALALVLDLGLDLASSPASSLASASAYALPSLVPFVPAPVALVIDLDLGADWDSAPLSEHSQ